MVPIRDCGLMLEPQQGMGVKEVVDWGVYAERQGYGYIFRSDHLMPIHGRPEQDSTECWVTLGAIAASTNRVKFGPMVSPIGFRNPVLLAQMACNLHSYSKGRLLLGVGAGWYKAEYLAKGYEFPALPVRQEQMMEALEIIRPLIDGERVDFKGKYYSAHTTCYPHSKSRLQLILGGRSSLVRRAGSRYADEFNLFNGSTDDFKQLKQQLSESGRKIVISRAGPFFLARTKSQLQRSMKTKQTIAAALGIPSSIDEFMKHNVLCGDVDQFSTQLRELRKAGVDRFYFDLFDPKDKKMVDLLTQLLKD